MRLLRIIPTVIIAWILYHILWLSDYATFSTSPVAALENLLFTPEQRAFK